MENLQETKQANVDLVKVSDKEIYLVGTAHVSSNSVELVEQVIREVKPDSVAVELCDSRYQSLRDPDRWRNTDIMDVIKSGRAYVLTAQLILASFQRKIGMQLNIRPGAEMLRAVEVAEELDRATVLADREVKITLKRTWASMGFWTGCKLLVGLLASMLSKAPVKAEEIEALKSDDILTGLLGEFSEKYPRLRETLIDERDRYLASKIQGAPGQRIVAVVGAGHVPGLKRMLGKEIDTAVLETVPEKSGFSRLLAWSIPVLVLAMVIYGFFVAGASLSVDMLQAWFWITGFGGALGAALALGHPLTILSAFLATPLATLHPLIAAGWIAGLVEAWLRRPRVADFESVLDDLGSFRGIFSNRVTRILLVIAFTNLMATIAMIWGAKMIAELLLAS